VLNGVELPMPYLIQQTKNRMTFIFDDKDGADLLFDLIDNQINEQR